MKSSELIKFSIKNLKTKIIELEKKRISIACSTSMSTITDTSSLKRSKRIIARAKTILNEKMKNEKSGKNS